MLRSITEKRINCSINTWIRGPGITAFCTLALVTWFNPAPGTPAADIIPWYIFWPAILVCFFNGPCRTAPGRRPCDSDDCCWLCGRGCTWSGRGCTDVPALFVLFLCVCVSVR